MEINNIFSPADTQRLEELGFVFENRNSGFIKQVNGEILKIADTICKESLFSSKRFRESPFGKAYFRYKLRRSLEIYGSHKVSPALSDFLWPFEESDDQIEFRSPVPDFPSPEQITVVSSNERRRTKGVGEYCLAACDDGMVRWVHESECVNDGNHVWTVHWFDLRGGGTVYFGDRLQRPVRNVCINVVNNFVNKIVGGNVNWSGTQNIASVNCG